MSLEIIKKIKESGAGEMFLCLAQDGVMAPRGRGVKEVQEDALSFKHFFHKVRTQSDGAVSK